MALAINTINGHGLYLTGEIRCKIICIDVGTKSIIHTKLLHLPYQGKRVVEHPGRGKFVFQTKDYMPFRANDYCM